MSGGKGVVNTFAASFYFLLLHKVKGAGIKSLLIYAFVQIGPLVAADLVFTLLFVVALKSRSKEEFIFILQTFFML